MAQKNMCIKENTSFPFHNYVKNCQRYSFMYAKAFKKYYIKMIWWLSSNHQVPRIIDLNNISPLKWQYWFDELLQSDAW